MNEAPNHALISPLRLSGKRFLKDFFAMVLMDDLPTSILSNSATKGLPLLWLRRFQICLPTKKNLADVEVLPAECEIIMVAR